MATSPTTVLDAPIIGPDGNVLITVEESVSFRWVPVSGNSYVGDQSWMGPYFGQTQTVHWTGVSRASGYVTFNGVTSSEPFQSLPSAGSFTATDGIISVDLGSPFGPDWTYDPTTGVLNPNGLYEEWNVSIWAGFGVSEVAAGWSHGYASGDDLEYGSWQLVPNIHNVDVFGGVGNDTILGGQGTERLFGGEGNDLIRAGIGDDLVRGGTGNDQLYAGVGKQTVMGGVGNDTIWGGSGTQLLIGGQGQDMIHGGSGPQTLMGGTGNATLSGGSGSQSLEGGDGNNLLQAGSGTRLCPEAPAGTPSRSRPRAARTSSRISEAAGTLSRSVLASAA